MMSGICIRHSEVHRKKAASISNRHTSSDRGCRHSQNRSKKGFQVRVRARPQLIGKLIATEIMCKRQESSPQPAKTIQRNINIE